MSLMTGSEYIASIHMLNMKVYMFGSCISIRLPMIL